VREALENNEENEKWEINRKVLNEFNKKSKSIREFLTNYIPYYPLTKSQIEEIIKQHKRGFINIEKVLKNPYLLYEELKPKDNLLLNISFWEIDNWELRRLGENNFDITNKHRIRAMLIAILKKALSEGHTVLPLTPRDLPSVKKDLRHYYDEINKYLPEDVRIDFDRFLELIDEYEEYIKEKVWIGETEFEDELGRKYKLRLFALKEISPKIEKYLYQWSDNEVLNSLYASKWCLDNDRFAQALTFAHEGMISFFCKIFWWDKSNKEHRNSVDFTIQIKIGKAKKENFKNSNQDIIEWYKDNIDMALNRLDKIDMFLLKGFIKLRNWRNTINHAKDGDRKNMTKNFPILLEKYIDLVENKDILCDSQLKQ